MNDTLKTIAAYREQHEIIRRIIQQYQDQDDRLFQIMLDGIRHVENRQGWTSADEFRPSD